MRQFRSQSGWIEVIAGGMFSGKSEELIRRLRRATIAKQKVVCFKPDIDTRYSGDIHSHSDARFPSEMIPSQDVERMLQVPKEVQVVGIDEGQFFPRDVVQVARTLASRGHRVIIATLDLDYRGHPFGPAPLLMAEAEDVVKLRAVCTVCGQDATRSQRIADNREQVVVGAAAVYEARCWTHWSPEPLFSRQENILEMDG